MKIAVLVARILLGLIFVVFGLNGFLNFLHAPMPPGQAGQYMGVMFGSLYLHFVFLVQACGRSCSYFPANLSRWRWFCLARSCSTFFSFTLASLPAGLPPGLLSTLLWFIIFFGYRRSFAGIFAQKAPLA